MFTKTINPSYATIGKRRTLTGFIGTLADESGVVLHSLEYPNYGQAEHALNALSYELLTDYAERGLVDTLPVACVTCGDDGDCPDCETPLLVDAHHAISLALGHTAGATSIVDELRRVQARLESALA